MRGAPQREGEAFGMRSGRDRRLLYRARRLAGVLDKRWRALLRGARLDLRVLLALVAGRRHPVFAKERAALSGTLVLHVGGSNRAGGQAFGLCLGEVVIGVR